MLAIAILYSNILLMKQKSYELFVLEKRIPKIPKAIYNCWTVDHEDSFWNYVTYFRNESISSN